MKYPDSYQVRFKGHLCAAISCGLSRKPILIRARKKETIFEVIIPYSLGENIVSPFRLCSKVARLECARAIRRTEHLRKRLQGNHLLRGIKSVERLLRDYEQTRRGKRWKICPLYAGEGK